MTKDQMIESLRRIRIEVETDDSFSDDDADSITEQLDVLIHQLGNC